MSCALHAPGGDLSGWTLDPAHGELAWTGQAVLQLQAGWSCEVDATGAGVLLSPPASDAASYQAHRLGRVSGMTRFTSLTRFSPFWTRPAVGRHEEDVCPETLWLLAQTQAGQFTLLVPLLDAVTRYALSAQADALLVVAETGDPAVPCGQGPAVWVGQGADPYALVAVAAKAVSDQVGVGRLRLDKAVPEYIDALGWCTWDAFYKDVTPDKLLQGLESLRKAGASPRWVILDDGWLSRARGAGGEDRLCSLLSDAPFGGDLTPLIRQAKKEHGVRHFMVWHALLGYWGGLSEEAFADYGVRSVPRSFGPGLLAQEPRWNVQPWGAQQGVPDAAQALQFYQDWHASLARQGVDGVKVDAQAMLEAVSSGQGGRVVLAKAFRRALETSVREHFQGRLINCMSCGSEGAYLSQDSTVMRTSDDFFPQRPDSHGLHVFTNALASLWWGEFMQPDWDMFQSAHAFGAFHAVARAVSGGPVYVSDGPGQHDAAVLKKLVLSDGGVLRADFPGRPCPDVLMTDPTTEPGLFKVFNRNRACAVVALFHVTPDAQQLTASVSLDDVPGLSKAPAYVAWSHRSDQLWLCDDEPVVSVTLAPADWEIVSFAPIEHGLAVLGLADKYNSTGAVVSLQWHGGTCEVTLRDGGDFLAWAWQAPLDASCEGLRIPVVHDPLTGLLRCHLPAGGVRRLRLTW